MRLRPRAIAEFPELPEGCPPLTPSVSKNAPTAVRNNLDALPGLCPDRLSNLSRVTAAPDAHVSAGIDGTPVLALEDLLRRRPDGTVTLHPHVVPVLPFGAADTVLQSVCTLYDTDPDAICYLYPEFVLECHGITPDREALFPPAYEIQTLDVLCELRANNILTSVRQPDQPFTDAVRVRDAVDTAETAVHASLTLHQEAGESRPTLSVNAAHDLTTEPPTADQLAAQCQSLCKRLGASLKMDMTPPSDDDIPSN